MIKPGIEYEIRLWLYRQALGFARWVAPFEIIVEIERIKSARASRGGA